MREIQIIPWVHPVEEVTAITIKLDKIASDNILSAKLALKLGYNVVGSDDPEDEVICNGRPMYTRGVTLIWLRVPKSQVLNSVGGSSPFCQVVMRISNTLEQNVVLSRDTLQLLELVPHKEDTNLHRAKEALQYWKKAKRTIRLRQEKVRLRKLQETMEARRQLLPPGTSLHSSPLAAPLIV